MDDDLFIAVFDGEVPPSVVERAQELDDVRVHELAANLLLVSVPDATSHSLVRMLMPEYDLTEDPGAVVVFKLNGSYTGYYHRSLWDWLDGVPSRKIPG